MTAKGERQVAYDVGFIGSDKPAPTGINIAQHQVSEHTSTEGKKILVFDDLFDKEDLDRLRAFIFKHGTYYYDDSDDGDDGGDNVQWIAGFEINEYIQSRLWNIMQQVCAQSVWVFKLQVTPSKGIQIPECEKFWLVESVILDFGIQNKAQGIQNPTNSLNPESKFHWLNILTTNMNHLSVIYMKSSEKTF